MISKRTTVYLSKIYDQRFGNGTELGNSGWASMKIFKFVCNYLLVKGKISIGHP